MIRSLTVFLFLSLFVFADEPNLQLGLDENLSTKLDDFSSFSAKPLKNCVRTAYFAKLKSGENLQYCDLGELSFHSMDEDILFSSIKVTDNKTLYLIPALKANYVANEKGEFAFEKSADALEFITKFGGEILSFNDAFDKAYKRQSKAKKEQINIKKAKKIYEKRCEKLSKNDYRFINELKADAFKKCKNLYFDENLENYENLSGILEESFDEKKADLVTNFIWFFDEKNENLKIEFSKSTRCPICGMFVYKYPKWAVSLSFKDEKFAFDGIKDMMKFILKDERFKSGEILVRDYYTQKIIDAKNAFFVVGSDVLGPMGNELIAFETMKSARTFRLEHGGTEIYKFDEITNSVTCALDGRSCE
ncbi:nitrous oxide reductase accessory protein NosL [Campylobacter ureolyticus]|uniref:NosL domain-containing protein n=1 Tax=Campylobacter ureolyticus TaxID=827 RepID=A0AAE7E8X8_9BACT|nr:nitrous oxide reductase accessory protein NosL [Campylobacter ureolyticus]MCR8684123.1 nitrous oxide reductase accessory protein NosL [Campylobacter ureolyticus]QKF83829.1 NosL domain-containing protein [Campylobacter ureolyticus]QQY36017.1 nitrous oxide reductase accessory protein NosL [Campylobacter ureolyticus]SUX24663.1 NosL protein [Campylobacter ureolyticus]